ncbi:hypothetical protein HNQ51_001724 [Inhella inkyongensis]|uniref:Mor transcription activator domain-containing protein n=1 Tax=Inhella inkyongensis TaxID=392593 RepID=A0A840S7I6_9BURK|nr:Mor transcription activator family protein [Inhella inkyongensis]MBB5204410.1 hypothetical protein [Inhella inkyongensis]
MTPRRAITAAELAVLETRLPPGLADGMRELALCLFEALVLGSGPAGAVAPSGAWAAQLQVLADLVLMQLQHLSNELGGRGNIYIAKGINVHLSARDRAMCARFRGNNYRELARQEGLTEMRVRQIVDAWQREQYQARQSSLPGLDAD